MVEEGEFCKVMLKAVGASQMALLVKNPPANAGDTRDTGFDPWAGKIPWRRAWQRTPVFLPRKSHGQRSLAGCSPWGHKELDTEHTHHHQRLLG